MRFGRNDRMLVICLAVVVGMLGMSYAAVPLYQIFCAVTGYGGTPGRADAASARIGKREITVRFDANVAPGLDWEFVPETRAMTVKAGENALAFFRAENTGRVPVTGHATFNVTPEKAAVYFVKVQCFCFTEQTLAAGEAVEMPVSFFVDPAIEEDARVRDVGTITLSYTFFPSANVTASVPGARDGAGG